MPGHVVTVTRTTTTTSSSAIILNTGICKSIHGILKLLQLLVGIAVVAILSFYYDKYKHTWQVDLYVLLVAVTFMTTTFLIIISFLISLATATILPKTVFEYVYHGAAFLLYLIAGIAFLAELNQRNGNRYKEDGYDAKMAAAVMALVNAGLYLFSAVMAYRVYRVG